MLDREAVLHVARLARLGLSEAEIDLFAQQLSRILEYMDTLQQLDTSAVPPTAQVLPQRNVMRPDKARPSLPRETVLANAPDTDGEFFRVQAILEAEES
jgi:aspartyl-tRNA(Asn)/glutamyl-tRNA(Gln) amidotransferase subunit C